MKKIKDWQEKNNGLERSFEFQDFLQAFAFLKEVAELAENHQHHPEIWNVYNQVKLRLCTHDAGHKITEKDYDLAEAINRLL